MKTLTFWTRIAFITVTAILCSFAIAFAVPLENTVENTGQETYDDGTPYSYWANSGTFEGILDGNEDINDIAGLLGYDYIDFAGKTDYEDGSFNYEGDYNTIELDNLHYKDDDTGEPISGTWEITDPADAVIDIYTLKAGDYYAVYTLDPAAGDGSWSTYHFWDEDEDKNILSGKSTSIALSHFSGFKTEPVPEPAVMLLMGIGLVAGAAYGKRRQNRSA